MNKKLEKLPASEELWSVEPVPVTARHGAVTQQLWLNGRNSSSTGIAIRTAFPLAHDRNLMKTNVMETLFQRSEEGW